MEHLSWLFLSNTAQPNLTIHPAIFPIIPSPWQADTNSLSGGCYCVSGGEIARPWMKCSPSAVFTCSAFFSCILLTAFDALMISPTPRLSGLLVWCGPVYSGASYSLSSRLEFPRFSTSFWSMSDSCEVWRVYFWHWWKAVIVCSVYCFWMSPDWFKHHFCGFFCSLAWSEKKPVNHHLLKVPVIICLFADQQRHLEVNTVSECFVDVACKMLLSFWEKACPGGIHLCTTECLIREKDGRVTSAIFSSFLLLRVQMWLYLSVLLTLSSNRSIEASLVPRVSQHP